VKMHLHHIYEKLRLGGRAQLAALTVASAMRTEGFNE
jgi:DNA-binding CsgD family transcriptional regulator